MPRPRKPLVPLWQQPITSFALVHGLQKTPQAAQFNPEKILLNQKIETFKCQHNSSHRGEVFILRKGHFLYYRDASFYHYYAYDPTIDRKVGELSLDAYDESHDSGEHALSGITVEIPYRRKGIGTTLINIANITNTSLNGSRLVIFGGQAYNSRYRLTAEGMQLARACIQKGILDHDQFIEASVGSVSGSLESS